MKPDKCNIRIAQAKRSREYGIVALALALALFLGLGFGGVIDYASIFEPEEPAPAFTPVIDGVFNETEHWELAENIHSTFLEVDANHTEAYNYVYASRTNTSLLICLDLCSDTTDDRDEGEWISLWIDSDNSRNIWNYTSFGNLTEAAETFDGNLSETLLFEEYINWLFNYFEFMYNLENDNGTELVIYDVSADKPYKNFTLPNDPGILVNSTCEYEIEYSFMSTPNFALPHRVFEFNISLNTLENMTATSDYGLFIEGYGTMALSWGNTSSFKTFDFYTLPSEISGAYWSSWVLWELYLANNGYDGFEVDYKMFNVYSEFYAMITLPTIEQFYFRMGSKVNDLNGPV